MNLTGTCIGLDADGTLIDNWERQLDLLDWCAQEAGLTEINKSKVRLGKRSGLTSREALLQSYGPCPEIAAASECWRRLIESDAWLKRDRLLPGAREVLVAFVEAGADIVIISARQRPEALAQQLRTFNLASLIVALKVVSPFDAVDQKAVVLRDCGAKAYIGDSVTDAEACRIAGVPFFAVATGQHSAELLSETSTRFVGGSLHDAASAVLSFVARQSSPSLELHD